MNHYIEEANYWNDPRTRAAMVSPAYSIVEEGPGSTVIELDEGVWGGLVEDGDLPEDHDGRFTVPTCREVCPTCEGTGTCVNPSIDCGGLTSEDFAEDPEFAEAYWSGGFDVVCPECHGRNVVPVLQLGCLPAEVQAAIEDWEREEADYVALVAAERTFGC